MATPDPTAPLRRLDIVCPQDGGALAWDEAGLTCRRCGCEWDRVGDVPVFGIAGLTLETPHVERPAPGAPDDFEAAVDWRFLLPIDSESRVLVIGFGEEEVAAAIAPDVLGVAVIDRNPELVLPLDEFSDELGFDNLVPVIAPPGVVPFADASFDLVVLDGDLLPESGPEQIALLRVLRTKLTAAGRLFLPVANRWGRFFPADGEAAEPTPQQRACGHGLDGWRKLFALAGFRDADFHAAFPDARRPRELLPLDDPAAFDWWLARKKAHGSTRRMPSAILKHAFRVGLLPRLVPHFAVVARRG
jgi:hypothetical protein